MRKINKKQAGFTFIEVMIAISIISIGLVAVIQTFASIANAISISENNIKSVLLLEEKMEELEETNRLENGTNDGTLSGSIDGEKGFTWNAGVSSEEDSVNLKRLDFSLEWKSGKRSGDLNISTYLLKVEEEEEG